MFLQYKTPCEQTVGVVYSGLQKSVRTCDRNGCEYWSNQLREWPNALRKRICQNALEDTGNYTFVASLLRAHPPSKKPCYDDLSPYVGALCGMAKTHATAWLNRAAADELWNGNLGSASGTELERATHALRMHSEGRMDELRGIYGDEAVRVYLYVNKDPLVFHSIILGKRDKMKNAGAFKLEALPVAPVQEVKDYYLDKHTREGKRLGRGYSHFIANMNLKNPIYDPIELEPYRARAVELYTTFRLDGKECRVAHVLKAVREGKGDAKVKEALKGKEKEEPFSEGDTIPSLVSESTALLDSEVFAIDSSTCGLGFKNATFITSALVDLGGGKMKKGDRIFVKIGETPVDNAFAESASAFRRFVGLPSLATSNVHVLPTLDYGEIAKRGNEKWGTRVNGKVQKARISDGSVSALVVKEFEDGVRLTSSDSSILDHPNFGIELLKTLLFRKFIGSRDTNGFNLMVRVTGSGNLEILSVDETMADEERLRTYDKKGLITSQSFGSSFLAKCATAIEENWEDVDDFIGKLNSAWLSRGFSQTLLGQKGRMTKTHEILNQDWARGRDGEKSLVCMRWLGLARKRKLDA